MVRGSVVDINVDLQEFRIIMVGLRKGNTRRVTVLVIII
jgi:hypothetical protein